MIGTSALTNDEFNALLSLDSWFQERLAEDCYYAAQAFANNNHKTIREMEDAE